MASLEEGARKQSEKAGAEAADFRVVVGEDYWVSDDLAREEIMARLRTASEPHVFTRNRRWNLESEIAVQKLLSALEEVVARLEALERKVEELGMRFGLSEER